MKKINHNNMKEEMYNLVRHENKRTRYTNGNCIFIVSLEMNLIKVKSEKESQ